MSFPSTSAPSVTKFATSVTSMSVSLPASIVSGYLLIAVVEVRNTGTFTVPSGWTQFFTQAGGSSVGRLTGFYRIADGTEGASAAWVHSIGTSAIWFVQKVTSWEGATAPEATTSSGDFSTNPNSPNLSPSWGAADTLWLTFAANTASSIFTNGGPTNYSDYQADSASSGGAQVQMAKARRELNAGSEDPDVFGSSGSVRYWAAATIGIRPAIGGGGTEYDPITASVGTFAYTGHAANLLRNESVRPFVYE